MYQKNSLEKTFFVATILHPLWTKVFKSETPSSITFPQWFRISKHFWHWILGRGGKRTFKRNRQKMDRHTDRHTHTHRRTNQLIESIGPKGRCFEKTSLASRDEETGWDEQSRAKLRTWISCCSWTWRTPPCARRGWWRCCRPGSCRHVPGSPHQDSSCQTGEGTSPWLPWQARHWKSCIIKTESQGTFHFVSSKCIFTEILAWTKN